MPKHYVNSLGHVLKVTNVGLYKIILIKWIQISLYYFTQHLALFYAPLLDSGYIVEHIVGIQL